MGPAFLIYSPDMRNSRYTLVHAVAASLALVALILSNGVAAFWRQFVYGLNMVMTPEVLSANLQLSTKLFGGLLLVLWATSLCGTRPQSAEPSPTWRSRLQGVRLALVWIVPATLLALGLNWLNAHAIEWITHVKPADQELVRCFTDGHYSAGLRCVLVLAVLFQAPLLEEPIFRGVIFRGFCRAMPEWGALLLSGAVFAVVHVNAASFVPLVFLGGFFAWLYARTRTILAPMAAHFVFNAINLVLLLFFPELAANS